MSAAWGSPVTGRALREVDGVLATADGAEVYGRVGPVWDLTAPGRRDSLDAWARAYAAVRRQEGWAPTDDEHRRLPDVAADHPLAALWSVRAATFTVVRTLCQRAPCDIVDVGAGNGWASRRLAELGHRVVLVDVNVDDADGLGVAARVVPQLPAARGEAERLPLLDASADVVLFNASFHYAGDQRLAVDEALRVLRPGGRIVIADSPLHHHPRSGELMVAEQRERLASLMSHRGAGERPPDLAGAGFVCWRDVRARWGRADLDVDVIRPRYGPAWGLRRLRGALATRREPSQFRVLVLGRAGEASGTREIVS